MNIVILDGHTTSDGDLGWHALRALGQLRIYDRSAPDEIVPRAREADAVLLNKARLDAQALAQLPRLRYIGILATGYNTVDTAAAAARGIPVCNAAGYGSASVAQHVFALLLDLVNHVALHADDVATAWPASPDWTYRLALMTELDGKTMGIVGLGQIGQATARIAQAFGMRVVAHNRSPRAVPGVEMLDLEALFAQSDVVSLHCPLTADNTGFVDAALLARMKPSALLINTARGPLIDEQALAAALQAGQIAGAGLDVLSAEPPPPDHPLLRAPRCRITPHNAWGSRESRARLIAIAADNLRAFRDGRLQNVVNGIVSVG
ncbi:MAG: D-2-hydroxyacid dehydrogenase [Bacteroidia bacterium]